MLILFSLSQIQFKAIAEKMRDLLPQPSISNNQTVDVENAPPTTQDEVAHANDDGAGAGAGDVMSSPFDEHENLV